MDIKRICILTTGVYPIPATSGGAVEGLIDAMLEDNDKHGYECSIDVISCRDSKAEEVSHKYCRTHFIYLPTGFMDMKVYPLIRRFTRKLFRKDAASLYPFLKKAIKVIKKSKYDCVLVENREQFVAPLKKKIASSIMLHLHNDTVNPEFLGSEAVVRNADKILCVSDYISKRVNAIGYTMTQTRVVKNVIDYAVYDGIDRTLARAEVFEQYNIPKDSILYIYAGRLDPQKGVDLLIEAFLETKNPKTVLMIVGGSAFANSCETPYVVSLKELSKAASGRILFTDFIGHERMPNYFSAGDIAIFPSVFEEPASLVNLEAQACSLPTIISDAGGMPEHVTALTSIVVKRGAGFVNDLAVAMDELADNPQKRAAMGQAAKANAKQYDTDGYLGRILEAMRG